MASTTQPNNNFHSPNFILSPHQQDLLFAALNSNGANANPAANHNLAMQSHMGDPAQAGMPFAGGTPLQAPGSSTLTNLDDSPFIDYDYDFDNSAGDFGDFDFSAIQGQMIGNLPGNASSSDGDAIIHDKRGHSDEDNDEDEHGGKRREGEEKGAKKPGRKPLTSEPTTKRKAQNRAAQRAFRERKEKHLKDLETKVQDLEKASESANHENLILRAKVEKMTAELKEYKSRAALNPAASRSPTAPAFPSYLKGAVNMANNPNDVNFSFEFPRFGKLPGPPTLSKSDSNIPKVKTSAPPAQVASRSTSFASNLSPTDNGLNASRASAPQASPPIAQQPADNDMSQFSGLFSPGIPADGLDYMSYLGNGVSRSSTDSNAAASSTGGQNTSQSSPASSNSHHGTSSSCGTSPEPFTQSPPTSKLDSMLTTIGEEGLNPITGQTSFCEKLSMACGNPNNPIPRTMSASEAPAIAAAPSTSTDASLPAPPSFDINSLDWFASQNNNQFDPQLFGDYREPQDNILAGGLYDDTFFGEAYALRQQDFMGSPFNLDAAAASPGLMKKDLVSAIDEKLREEEDDEVVPAESEMLTCTNMWEKIQACPRVQNGEIDMDSLCTQLQQKAKCSGEGPVIQESDFKDVLNTMFTAQGLPPCTN